MEDGDEGKIKRQREITFIGNCVAHDSLRSRVVKSDDESERWWEMRAESRHAYPKRWKMNN